MSASTRSEGPAPHLHILVTDDNADQRKFAIAALTKALEGLFEPKFSEADSGADVLTRADQGGLGLVLLDYQMPGKDGLTVLTELQARHPSLPVVLVTADGDREVMLEAMRRGATDFLAKTEFAGPRLAHVVRSSLELAQLRADVMRSQKLAAIGTLAGGIAHEFNNILQIILGHSQYALTREEPERWKKALRYCQDAADKGARIVRQLLTFARRRSTGHTRFSLDKTVAQAVQADAEAARRDGVKVNVDVRATPMIAGDNAQIMQVILNLLTNARHACTAMVTSRAQLSPHIEVALEVESGMARVRVRDNGIGMSPEELARVFEPFYTTKGSLGGRVYDGKSSGTGLGLSISASIVQGHDGRIDVQSTPGEGSTFTLMLPVAPAESARAKLVRRSTRSTGMLERALFGRRVLVVDDEELVADLLGKYLEEKGLYVEIAHDATTAFEALRGRDFDLLLFDLTLPGDIGGLELLRRCRTLGGPNAAAPALAMTGHTPGAEDEKLFDAGFRGIVRKPFEMRELGRLIADLLRTSQK